MQANTYEFFLSELEQYNIMEVAEEAGVHYTTLYLWLRGKTKAPKLSTLLQVAPVIGLTLSFQYQQAIEPVVLEDKTEQPKLRAVA